VEDLHIPRRDVIYLAENGRLRLSIRVFHLECKQDSVEEHPDTESRKLPKQHKVIDGLLDLRARDVHALFRDGSVAVSSFLTVADQDQEIQQCIDPLNVKQTDLLIRVVERRRLEALIRKKPVGSNFADAQSAVSFVHAPDYRMVQIDGETFSLGLYQAAIVRLLHKAALTGRPWCNGAELLAEIECSTLRMSDLFKSKRGWRKLIESNSRGMYRLAGIARS